MNGAPTFLGLFETYFVLCLFLTTGYCLVKIYVWLWSDWLESLEVGCFWPWRYPPKSTIVSWKQETLELGCIFTPQLKWSRVSRIKSIWRIQCFLSNSRKEFKEGLKAKKKRNKKNLNPPEGFCITIRIPKENLNLTQAEKKIKERNRRKKVSTAKAKRKRKERSRKSIFYYINLYLWGIVSPSKSIKNFSWLQQLHKSQSPLFALSRGKTTDKVREKEKRTLSETLSRKRKTENSFY